jgi:hypothetical protein
MAGHDRRGDAEGAKPSDRAVGVYLLPGPNAAQGEEGMDIVTENMGRAAFYLRHLGPAHPDRS